MAATDAEELAELRRLANVRTCLGMYNWARKVDRDDLADFYREKALRLRAGLRELTPEAS